MRQPSSASKSHVSSRAAMLGGGIALGLSFPPFPFPFLVFVAFIPLLYRWERAASWRAVLLGAYLTLLAAFAVAFSWPLLHVFPYTALASLNGILLLPLFLSLPFAISHMVRHTLGRAAGLAALMTLYLTAELALSRGPLAFPWPLLGHSLSEALLLNQFAEFTGVAGLTFWILLTNGCVFLLLTASPAMRRRHGLALAAVSILPALLSLSRLPRVPEATQTLTVGLVQPGIGSEVWADVHDTSRVDSLLALSDALLAAPAPDPGLIVWPETALPLTDVSSTQPGSYRRIQAWSTRRGVPLLTGAIQRADAASYVNAALLFSPAQPVQRYDKKHLVPFAERVPFVESWPALRALAVPAGGVSGYRAGAAQPLLHTDEARWGVLICLESLFGDYARRYVAEGAALLVVLTQDGWWGRSPGYRQHLAFTRLRAIETHRAVVQVAVSGTSALILPDGSTAFQTRWMERTARTVEVPLLTTITFYTRHGDWLSYVALALAVLLLFAAAFRKLYCSFRASAVRCRSPEVGATC